MTVINKYPIGIDIDSRRTVNDAKRGTGFVVEKVHRKDLNQLLYELNADWIIGTSAQVTANEANTYYDSTSTSFLDQDASTVTFADGDKIVWRGLDAITASIDISTIDDLEHIMWQGVTIALGSYNLSLGENQRGELNLSGTGTLAILSSSGLRIVHSGLTINNSDGDIIINNISSNSRNKNTIINGDFDIWERGSSITGLSDGDYTADRFVYTKIGTSAVHDIIRSTDVPAGKKSNYSLYVDCTTADAVLDSGDVIAIGTRIEGYDYKKFENNFGALSFWVKSTKTGTFCVSFRNSVYDRSYIAEYTINTTDTWEYKEIVLEFDYSGGTWDYTDGIGLEINWALMAGSSYQGTNKTWNSSDVYATSNQVNACDSVSNDFRLSQVQFELSNLPTRFEERSISIERAMCQRYYQHYSGDDDPVGVGIGIMSYYSGSTAGSISLLYQTEMRSNPTFGYSSLGAINMVVYNSNSKTSTGLGLDDVGRKGASIDITTGSTGLTESAAARAVVLNGEYISFDAEL